MKKLGLLMTALLLAGLLAACSGEEDTTEEETERIVPVETAEAESGDFEVVRSLTGRVSPKSTTPIMLQSAGEVVSLKVPTGNTVAADDVIATIDSPQSGEIDITAPAAGEVLQVNASKGENVGTEEAFAVIGDIKSVNVELTAASSYQQIANVDDTVTVLANGEELDGTITQVGKMPDDTGLYPITVSVNNEEAELLPGAVVTVEIPETAVEDAVLVPTEAVFQEDDNDYVYVVNGDLAVQVEVEVLETQTDQTALKASNGTAGGDEIVTTGQLTLSNGAQVEVKGE